jgi:crotonobetainyl-CoA:carnitine CoA-transferase CaiB-like acyl-CoA transferase
MHAPQLGEHTAEISGALGVSEQQIAALKKNSVV